jgi:hypothetical protein
MAEIPGPPSDAGGRVSVARSHETTHFGRRRYLVERMRGLELYDLWLRAGHRHPASWIEFLCEGEGVFGDCIQAWKRKSRS